MEEELDEIARGERDWVPLLQAFYPPLRDRVDEVRKNTRRARLHDRGDRRGLLARPPDGHPPRAERPVPRLLAVPGAQGIAAAARRGAARPRPGEGETCPQCGEGTLVGKRGRFGPFVGCSRYPDCNYIKKEGPPPPDPLAFEVVCPKNADGDARRASRAADRQRLLGVLELPEVRLHDELRAGRRVPRRRRRAGREEGRVRDLPEVRRRRAAARRTTTLVGARLAGGPPNPEALARPARRRPGRRRRGGGRTRSQPSAAEAGRGAGSRTTRRTRQTEGAPDA